MLKDILKSLSLLFSIIAVMVFTGFALAGDILFFMSDTASSFVVVIAISIILAVPAGAVLLGLYAFSSRARSSAGPLLGRAFTVLITVNFLYLLLNMIDVKFLLTLRAKYHIYPYAPWFYPEFLYPLGWIALVLLVWRYLRRSKEAEAFKRRGTVVAMAAAPLAIVLFLVLVTSNRLSVRSVGAEEPQGPGHVVLVVLDGWPSQYARDFSYGDGPLSENALFFTNHHVNTVWTNGYFGALYKGNPGSSFLYMSKLSRLFKEASDSEENLLSALQKRGVKTRSLHWHRNGMSEGSAGRTYNYKGFRSVFLTPRYSRMLHALGLNYSMAYRGPSKPVRSNNGNDARSYYMSKLLPGAFRTEDYGNIFTEVLIPEMSLIRESARRSLIIFHVEWDMGDGISPVKLDDKATEQEIVKLEEAKAKIEAQDYHILPEDDWYMEKVRRKIKDTLTGAVERRLSEFLDEAGRTGLLEDAMLILTADHGLAASGGKAFYMYHPDEESARTPLVVFGAGRTGKDDRKVETIDIAQTLLENFGSRIRFHPRARSFLGDAEKPFTSSVTQPSDKQREWFVTIYKGDRKFLFNIHPKSGGESLEQKVEGFNATTVAKGPEVIERVAPELLEAFSDFGLYDVTGRDIHPSYARAAIEKLREAE
jgi:hypothetical protein